MLIRPRLEWSPTTRCLWPRRSPYRCCARLHGSDLTSEDDEGFSRGEAGELVRFLWMAGTETIDCLLVRSLLLLDRSELRTQLREDSALLPASIGGTLRVHPAE